MKCMYEKNRNKHLTTNDLVDILYNSKKDGKRYCFILGSGASVESGIPTGIQLERKWVDEMILAGENEEKIPKPTSENYFKIFEMRFKTPEDGYKELENLFGNLQPSRGYMIFASLIVETKNNLVISTNFDTLVEKSVHKRNYLDEIKVISHESLVQFMNESMCVNTPTIAKIHRDLYFNPRNRTNEVTSLPDEWKVLLTDSFEEFIPIIIGYAGGDHSLMDFLESNQSSIKEFYWCTLHNARVSKRVNSLLLKKNGHLVKIKGFENLMEQIRYKLNLNTDKYICLKQSNSIDIPSKFIPTCLNAIFDTGIENIKQDKYDKALECFDYIINTSPSSLVYTNRGYLYLAMQDLDRSFNDCQEAIKLDTTFGEPYILASQIYCQMGNLNMALNYCNKAMKYLSNDLFVFSWRGVIYFQLKLYDKALADFDYVITNATDYNIDKFHLMDCYKRRGIIYQLIKKQYKKCIEDYRIYLDYNSTDINILNKIGNAYAELKIFSTAIFYYKKILKMETDQDVLNNLGCVYLELKKYDKAKFYFEKCLDLNPNHPDALANLGYVYINSNNYSKAIFFLKNSLELCPESRGALFNMGYVNLKTGNYPVAISYFQKYLKLYPDSEDALCNMGYLYYKLEYRDDAIYYLKKCLKLNPNHVEALQILEKTKKQKDLSCAVE